MAVHVVLLLFSCSYVKLRKLPQFANSSIITMTHNNSSSSSSNGNGTSRRNKHLRDISAHAEVDTLMLAEVLAVALEGNKYLQQLQKKYQHAAAAAGGHGFSSNGSSNGSSSSSSVPLGMAAAEALPWLKGLLWTMSMYFAGMLVIGMNRAKH